LSQVAYVDSSCMISIALGEPYHRELSSRLSHLEGLFSSNLLEADLRAAVAREGEKAGGVKDIVAWMNWVHPYRPLTPEFQRVLEVGLLKGSDLWHVACALFMRRKFPDIRFITTDGRQGEIARSLGFRGL
jgi:hypothetical protein